MPHPASPETGTAIVLETGVSTLGWRRELDDQAGAGRSKISS